VLLVGVGVVLGVIVLRIRGRDGKETQITIPEGSQAHVDDKGKVTVTLPQDPKGAKPPRVAIEPEPWDLPRGRPLSPIAAGDQGSAELDPRDERQLYFPADDN
jgi:hypothetical protein